MAREVNLRKGSLVTKGVVGFSWTTFFFGFFVPLFRGDWKWFFIMLVAGILTAGLSNIVFCFIYNKIYTRDLLESKGYEAADDFSTELLAKAELISIS